MSSLLAAVIFLMFEFNIIFSIHGGATHALYLLPRFAGYLMLLLWCKGLDTVPCFQKRKGFFGGMALFELLRWLGGLFLYGAIEATLWQFPVWPIVSVLSLCGMLYTVKIITDALSALEDKKQLGLSVQGLKRGWYCLLALGVLSILATAASSPAVYWAALILGAIAALYYCVELLRYQKAFFLHLPRDQAGDYQ